MGKPLTSFITGKEPSCHGDILNLTLVNGKRVGMRLECICSYFEIDHRTCMIKYLLGNGVVDEYVVRCSFANLVKLITVANSYVANPVHLGA